MENKRNGSRGCLWAALVLLVVMLGVSLLVSAGLVAALALSKSPSLPGEKAVDEFPRFTETWSYGHGDIKAVRISFSGVVDREREENLFGMREDRIERVLRQIRAARNDGHVAGILFEVDSPGGAISPSEEVWKALTDFRTSRDDRFVIGFVRDMAASGGYYMLCAADHIIAEPTALVGSISVILQTLNWKVLSEKVGVTDTTIKSGRNKDMLNPFHEVSPEQVALLQETIDILHQRFVERVLEKRSLDSDQLPSITDGRLFTADQALNLKLVDELGYWDDVLNCAKKLAGGKDVKIVRYEAKRKFLEMLAESRLSFDPGRLLMQTQSPQFLYLWKP